MKKNIKFHKKKFLLLKIITLFIISIYFLSCSKKIEISNQITKEKYFSKEIKNGDILTFEWKHSFEHILWKEFYKIEKDGSFTLFSIVTEGFGAGIPAEMDCTYRYENGLIYMENIKGSNFKDFNWIHSKEHLKKIHKYLFDNIYYFAGNFRSENIIKGETLFCQFHLIEKELDNLYKREI